MMWAKAASPDPVRSARPQAPQIGEKHANRRGASIQATNFNILWFWFRPARHKARCRVPEAALSWHMITQKMKYALKALMVLADERAGEGNSLQIEEIARRSGTPKRFLEHILLQIRDAGIIASVRGRKGGYRLIMDSEKVAIEPLLRLIEGPLAPLPCLSRSAYERCEDCPDEETCRLRRVFGQIFWSYLILIESLTLADLVRSNGAELALSGMDVQDGV